MQVAQGDLAGALKSYRDSVAIGERLAKSDPGNAGWQRELSASYENVGNVQAAQGNLGGALASYRDKLAIMERLTKSDPSNAGWQQDLAVSYAKVGDVQVAQGDLSGALASFRESSAIMERLAKSDPSNTGWLHNLAASYERIGNVLVQQGDLGGALKTYRDSLSIGERLAKTDPGNAGWQHGLAASYGQVGNVLVMQGDLAGALKSYRDGFAIMERLTRSDPGNAGWLRDLAVSYERIGNVLVAQGDLAARSRPTVTASPSGSGWRNPIPAMPAGSAIWRCRMRRSATCRWRKATLRARSSPTAMALAIMDRLAKIRSRQCRAGGTIWHHRMRRSATCWWRRATLRARSSPTVTASPSSSGWRISDPGNAGWQRDLAASYAKVGNVQVTQGDLAGALKSYRDSLAISERLTKIDPEQCRVAARSGGIMRRLGTCSWRKATLPARSGPTATASPSLTGWQNPIRAMRTGSVLWRHRT